MLRPVPSSPSFEIALPAGSGTRREVVFGMLVELLLNSMARHGCRSQPEQLGEQIT